VATPGQADSRTSLEAYLRDKQTLIDTHLRSLLHAQRGCPATLLEAMEYSLLAPGKRLRPALVIMSAEACGGTANDALPAACAVEMVHTYSLIHDDLPAMDDDDLRRGLPTCHKKFGEALAILAGDGLLTLAFQVIAEGFPPATAAACCAELAKGAGVGGMVGGQVDDLAWEKTPEAANRSLAVLENIHAMKTGALFRSSLKLGVYAAQGETAGGPDRMLLDSLDEFGRCLGQVFQITDDLLDVESNAETTGKNVQKDAARGKLTYPGLLGVAESRGRALELARRGRESLTKLGAGGSRLADLMDYVVSRTK
jgi:geranylgeranyl diphosphate synthase type II